jgi:phage shock protein C
MSEQQPVKEFYRIPEQGKIAGVCAGIAERFNIEVWLIRVCVVSAFFLGGSGFVFLMYIAAWFMLDKKPFGKQKIGGLDHSVSVKSKVWQQGQPPREAFREVKTQFRQIELRLRNVESFVTSKEFDLARQIDNL